MLRTTLPKLSQIQRPVRERLDAVVEDLRRIVLTDFTPIEEINDHLLWARGKLFRPTLLLLSNEVGGRPEPAAVTLAAVVELVHLATLVHDDSVDHSVLRRGMPTVNALWNHQTAVIMGDYLYSRAVMELARFGRIELVEVVAAAANQMSIGEMRQLNAADQVRYTEADYDRLIECKTAALMSAACEIGALAGEPRWRAPLAQYGFQLGMAFQIADDLIDYTESEAVTGKPTGHDLREHKMTLPLIRALGQMGASARAEVEEFFADPEPSDDGIARVVTLVHEHGGLEYARGRAETFGQRAMEALQPLPDEPATASLRDAVAYVIDRRR